MKVYRIGASNMVATYDAGTFVAETDEEAIEKARERYRKSDVGRTMNDVGAFRFYVKSSEKVNG